jgi:hypothetical protein
LILLGKWATREIGFVDRAKAMEVDDIKVGDGGDDD